MQKSLFNKSVALVLALALTMLGLSLPAIAQQDEIDLALLPEAAELYAGETLDLICYVVPEGADGSAIKWTTSKKSVLAKATDENGNEIPGVFRGVAVGAATVTATLNGQSIKCAVTVNLYPVREAYMDFVQTNPEFVLKVLDTARDISDTEGKDYSDVNESLFVQFICDLRNDLFKSRNIINEENFNEIFIDSVQSVSNGSLYPNFQTTLSKAYPDAVKAALVDGVVHEDFSELREFIWEEIQDHNMVSSREPNPDTEFAIVSIETATSVEIDMLDQTELPTTVTVISESGLPIKTTVQWDYVPDTDVPGTYEAVGHVTLPTGYVGFGQDFSDDPEADPEEVLEEGTISAIITINDKDFDGSIDENTEWKYSQGVLTISGTGAIPDYETPEDAPWSDIKRAINEIVIENGITSVGNNSLSGMENLSSGTVTLPDSVTSVGSGAFADTKVENVVLPPNITNISSDAFGDNNDITIVGSSENPAINDFIDASGSELIDTANDDTVALLCVKPVAAEGLEENRLKLEISGINLEKQPENIKILTVGYNKDNEVVTHTLINANAFEAGAVVNNANELAYVKAFLWEFSQLRPLCKSKSAQITK